MTWIKPTQPYLRRGDPLNQGVVGCWLMNEPTGPDTRDWSGRGNHATLVNGPTRVMTKMGRGIAFNGTSQYINVPVLTYSNATPYSVAMWVLPTDLSNTGVFYCEASTLSIYPIFYLRQGDTPGSVVVYVRNLAETVKLNLASTTLLSVNEPHSLVWTDHAGSGKLYIDGVLDATNFAYNPLGTYSMINACFGVMKRAAPSRYWNGTLLNGATYNRVLAPAEIRKLAGLRGDPFEQWRPVKRRRVYSVAGQLAARRLANVPHHPFQTPRQPVTIC